jgi:NAD-dependent DNA ligase
MNREQIKELINRRRRQILVHSCLYYRFNTTLVSDEQYDAWARELMQLQKQHSDIANECIEPEAFKKFSETTSGFNLPLYGWVQAMAEHLLRIHKQYEW